MTQSFFFVVFDRSLWTSSDARGHKTTMVARPTETTNLPELLVKPTRTSFDITSLRNGQAFKEHYLVL